MAFGVAGMHLVGDLEATEQVSLVGGEFAVPADFAGPDARIVITRDPRRWLWILLEPEWMAIAEKLEHAPIANEKILETVQSMVLGYAESHTVSARRTVRISDQLLGFARITDCAALLRRRQYLFLIEPDFAERYRVADRER